MAQEAGGSITKPMSSWELEDDWSDSRGGSTGGLSSSMMTVSS